MTESFYAVVLIILFIFVNWGLYKYRKNMNIEEGPFYSLFDSNGELVVLPRYIGSTPAHEKKREIGFVESLFNVEDMFQKQAELQGFETAEAYVAHLQGKSEEALIQEKTGLTKEAYYAQKKDMTEEEYRAVQNGTTIEAYRAQTYTHSDVKKKFCTQCGERLKTSGHFCSQCGHKTG